MSEIWALALFPQKSYPFRIAHSFRNNQSSGIVERRIIPSLRCGGNIPSPGIADAGTDSCCGTFLVVLWQNAPFRDLVSCTFISRVACSRIPASESDQGVLIFRDPDISMLWFSILRWISHLRPLYAPIRRERGFSEPIKMRFWALAMRRFFKSVPTHGGIFYSKEIRRLYGKDPQPMWMRHWLDDGRLAAMISWELTYVSSLWIRLLWLGAL